MNGKGLSAVIPRDNFCSEIAAAAAVQDWPQATAEGAREAVLTAPSTAPDFAGSRRCLAIRSTEHSHQRRHWHWLGFGRIRGTLGVVAISAALADTAPPAFPAVRIPPCLLRLLPAGVAAGGARTHWKAPPFTAHILSGSSI
jgi:hypothetical protein